MSIVYAIEVVILIWCGYVVLPTIIEDIETISGRSQSHHQSDGD